MLKTLFTTLLLCSFLFACAHTPKPEDKNNICKIFVNQRSWFNAAEASKEKWGTPIQVMMAIMYQESSFRSDARPERKWYLGFIPGPRPSSAYGYAQAQTPVWQDYMKETGNHGADRDNFSDAIDFIGWFSWKSRDINKVSLWHADLQYLNYHEGWSGYRHGSYKKKGWLIATAAKVKTRAARYGQQLQGCRADLQRGWLMRTLF